MAIALFKSSVCTLPMNDILYKGEQPKKVEINKSYAVDDQKNLAYKMPFDGVKGMGFGPGVCGVA